MTTIDGIIDYSGPDNWIATVTNGLCAEARKQIRDETLAHFTRVLEGELADGKARFDALLAATCALGEAKSAARRYRKEHLLEMEATQLESHFRAVPPWLAMLGALPIVAASAALAGVWHSAMFGFWQFTVTVGLIVAVWFYGARLSGRFLAVHDYRRAQMVCELSRWILPTVIAMGTACGALPPLSTMDLSGILTCLVAIVLMGGHALATVLAGTPFSTIVAISLWQKLRRDGPATAEIRSVLALPRARGARGSRS